MGLIEKCSRYTRAREVQASGFYPYFIPIEASHDTEVVIGGKTKIMVGSNNYMGLTHHPYVLERAKEALYRYGTGCTGSRFLNGTLDLHVELEEKLAELMGTESALVFSTGYQTNLGVISTLVGRGDHLFLDKLNHASIVDGASLVYGTVHRYAHGDLRALERQLQAVPDTAHKLVVTDGVFSMEGDIADLPSIVALTEKYGAELMVDDAHSIGVLGPDGAGTAAHFGLSDKVLLTMGTFSKSFASIGGFVAGPEVILHYLRHHARSLIFSASMPPASVATVLAALEVMKREPERRDNLWRLTHRMQEGLKSLGFDIGHSETPIIPVVIGEMEDTFVMWKALFDAGVFTNPVMPPAVPESQCRLRISLMATHTDDHIDAVLEAFATVGRAIAVI
ncbi:aminotransferase class I/II-fold pyridoxal phosphate-dependent enzyme [Longimicrobium sp.]|uniref:aminotransferase class I/II-fold pyridoxal phosphate-dependent enzyme n=1 Tax=Longimicrobium sp. TaxID=2029185 RepID=UPI002BE5C8F2|nr:aminotransferase class I/II-fold pyridoxal phosphate-dependent enzyme [Longimicrobium sp.]HSU14388.1 aminotransferase class I/II-fold pyridoxal phosphate-dependent enzyme [Longimicrobium sp.]